MEKDVLVSIQGLQFVSEEPEEVDEDELHKIETVCCGKYYLKNGTHFVLYEEVFEGMDEPVKNMFRFNEKEVCLTKKGPINVQMVFSKGNKTMSDYNTPYGSILMGLDTQEIAIEQDNGCIEVHISYALEANYQFVADCDITIKIKEKTQTE